MHSDKEPGAVPTGISRLAVAALVGGSLLGLQLRSGTPSDSPPSLETLKTLEYVNAPSQRPAVDPSEIRALFDACRSYSHGLTLLPGFREPIVTRGTAGIAIFKKASPSVVMVITANFKGDEIADSALGTGVIIDPSGLVLTNWHVIHGFEEAIIFLKPATGTEPDRKQAYGVRLVAQDEPSDLALLKITKPPAALPAIKLGDIAAVQVAEDIHVIGHPHGQLWSYSTGVVSQIRDNFDWQYSDGSKHAAKVIQMQTSINPGNSGGPVLDDNAHMLGLVAMTAEGQNLDYAVSVDVVKTFVTKSLANNSRGGASGSSERGKHFLAKTKEGYSALRSEYDDFTTFTVEDEHGTPLELIADSPKEGVLRGLDHNAFGGFSSWILVPISGTPILVRSTGNRPDVLSYSPITMNGAQ